MNELGHYSEPDKQEPQNKLSVDKAKKLLFFSFYFSQGDGGLQDNIFHWLHRRYPDYTMTGAERDDIYDAALPSIKKVVSAPNQQEFGKSGKLHKEMGDVEGSLSTPLGMMKDVLNGEKTLAREDDALVGDIAVGMIDRDFKFLIRTDGRPRSGEGNLSGPMADPYMSHICYYALQGRPTGMPEYDQLMQEVEEDLRTRLKDDQKLAAVIGKYNETHPESVVSLEAKEINDATG